MLRVYQVSPKEMSQVYGQAPSFSILDVMRGLARRKLMMLSFLILGVLAGVGVITVFKPTYQTEARVLIDNLDTPYDRANVTQLENRDVRIDERIIASQTAVLASEDLGLRVIGALDLTAREEFDPMKKGLGKIKQLMIATGFADDPRLMSVEQRALDHLTKKLTVYPIPLSNVIAIKYTAADGKTAADVANALAQTYVLSTRESKSGDNSRARQWLSGQIDELRSKVADSDAAVETFRASSGLFKGTTTTLGAQEISELNSQITLAEAASSEATAKADEIRSLLETRGSVEASSEVLSSATIQRLREQQVEAQRRLGELSATYLPNHPKMQAAQKQANELQRLILREALKIVDGLQGQAKIAAARAKSLRKSLEGLKSREGDSLQDEVKLKELERTAKANRDQLEVMLSRFADSNTRQNLELQPGFARIIQTASAPATPFFPRIGPTVLLATLAGLGMGIGLAFLLEIMAQAARLSGAAAQQSQPSIRQQHPARTAMTPAFEIPEMELAEAPVKPIHLKPEAKPAMDGLHFKTTDTAPLTLASLPQARTESEAKALMAALANGGSLNAVEEALTRHLKLLQANGSLSAVALTSVGGGLEVAASALALGRALSAEGIKTILVDLDVQRSVIAQLMDAPFAPGIVDLFNGSSDFSKAIQRDRGSELQFLRCGSADHIGIAQLPLHMEAVTRTLIGIYDCVLLNVGEATPNTLQLAKGCSTVLVHAPVRRSRDAIAAAGTLKGNGFKNIFMIQIEGDQRAAA